LITKHNVGYVSFINHKKFMSKIQAKVKYEEVEMRTNSAEKAKTLYEYREGLFDDIRGKIEKVDAERETPIIRMCWGGYCITKTLKEWIEAERVNFGSESS